MSKKDELLAALGTLRAALVQMKDDIDLKAKRMEQMAAISAQFAEKRAQERERARKMQRMTEANSGIAYNEVR